MKSKDLQALNPGIVGTEREASVEGPAIRCEIPAKPIRGHLQDRASGGTLSRKPDSTRVLALARVGFEVRC